jgi:hypothetical protein
MRTTTPHYFKVRVTKQVKIPVTIPFVLNGTPRIIGQVLIDGKEHPLYGYKEELVSQMVVVYAEKEIDIYQVLAKRFGTDIVYSMIETKNQ